MGDVEIQVWTDKKSRWNELLAAWLNFCKYEPLNASIARLLDEGRNRDGLTAMLKDMMAFDSTPLIVAWDIEKQQVAGFLFAIMEHIDQSRDDARKSLYGYDKYSFDPETLQKLSMMVEFLEDLVIKGDIFNRFGVDKVMSIRVTSVCPEYKRRGLANKMTAKFLEVAKEQGYTIVTSESTSAYTQHNKIKSFHFEKVIEVDYADHYLTYTDMPEDVKDSHKTVAILVKRL